MSPITSPPSLGYADWQRVQNWDGPLLWSDTTSASPLSVVSPVLQTSRYAGLGLHLQATQGMVRCVIIWYADQAHTTLLGERQMVLDAARNAYALGVLPNMGPWCQITLQGLGASPQGVVVDVYGSNRQPAVPLEQGNSLLALANNVSIPNGGTYDLESAYLYAGPVDLGISIAEASFFAYFFALYQDGNYYQLWFAQSPFTGVPLRFTAPMTSWYVHLVNSSGSPLGVTAGLISTVTGSS